jgi:hypothetical protein
MSCPKVLRAKDKEMLCLLSFSAATAERGDTEGTLAWKRKASRPFVPGLSWTASELSVIHKPLMNLKDIGPWESLKQVLVGRAFC